MESRRIGALALALYAYLVSIAGCRQATNHERLLQRTRERLLTQVKDRQAFEARLRRVGPGTPSAAVVKELGTPSAASPCKKSHECWFYEVSGRTYFVCLDENATVTCEGQAMVLRQTTPAR